MPIDPLNKGGSFGQQSPREDFKGETPYQFLKRQEHYMEQRSSQPPTWSEDEPLVPANRDIGTYWEASARPAAQLTLTPVDGDPFVDIYARNRPQAPPGGWRQARRLESPVDVYSPLDADPYTEFRRSTNVEDMRNSGWLPYLSRGVAASLGSDLMRAFLHPLTLYQDVVAPPQPNTTDDPMAAAAGYNALQFGIPRYE